MLGSSEEGENDESIGPIDEEWHVGLYGEEDYFSEDEEYDDQEELEDDLLDQFRAGLPSTAFSTANQAQQTGYPDMNGMEPNE